MKIWICGGCHAEIPSDKSPDSCPICKQHNRGFDEGFREEQKPEDKKYSLLYEKTLKELEAYAEGTEPETLRCHFDE